MMKFFHKVAALVLAASCFLPFSALAADKSAAVQKIIDSSSRLGQEKYFQYTVKGYLSTTLGRGDYELKGEAIQHPVLKSKAVGQVTLNTIGGSAAITPISFYVMEDSKNYVVYAKKGDSWVKRTMPREKENDPDKLSDILTRAIQTAHVLSDEKERETILFTIDPTPAAVDAQKDVFLSTAKKEDATFTKEDEKRILGSLREQNYLVTIDKKSKRPLAYEADCTPFAKAVMGIISSKVTEGAKMNEFQKQFLKSISDSARMQFSMNLTYNKGKDILLPDEAKSAQEEEEKKESITAGQKNGVSASREREKPDALLKASPEK